MVQELSILFVHMMSRVAGALKIFRVLPIFCVHPNNNVLQKKTENEK